MGLFIRNTRYRGKVKGIVLDWAGTAVDVGCMGPVSSFIEVFRRRGVDVSVAEARKPMGLMKKDHVRAMFENPSVAEKWYDMFGRDAGQADVDDMYLELEPLIVSTIASHCEPVPGLIEALEVLRRTGIKIGSSTGYTGPMMEVVVAEAARRGYRPDSVVSSTDVPRGRPYPYMCYLNAINLDIYPMEAMVKIGDTANDIYEGLNAGMWTVAVTRTSNELGMTPSELASIPSSELKERLLAIEQKLSAAGAHYVIEDITDSPEIIEKINARLGEGERP